MSRRHLGIGLLFIAATLVRAENVPSAPPTGEATGYQFQGQLGYRADGDEWTPLLPDGVFIGWGQAGCQPESQSTERLAVYPDGRFQLSISAQITVLTTLGQDGAPNRTSGPIVRWPCYRFRVDGCEDAVVQFGPNRPSGSIELKCPNREQRSRHDGSNSGLNPTACRVTALAWQVPRHSGRGLGVR
jgi:hypothetical protein